MSRRKAMVYREPNGKPQRSHADRGPAPAAVNRLRSAALAGMADARWATQLGRLHLAGKINDAQKAAGERWAERANLYRTAIDSPAADPKAIDMDRRGGGGADPDSEQGVAEAKRHRKACASFQDAHAALKTVGRKPVDVASAIDAGLTLRVLLSERVVRDCCERDIAPAGADELKALCTGLDALVAYWGLTNGRKSRHVR